MVFNQPNFEVLCVDLGILMWDKVYPLVKDLKRMKKISISNQIREENQNQKRDDIISIIINFSQSIIYNEGTM